MNKRCLPFINNIIIYVILVLTCHDTPSCSSFSISKKTPLPYHKNSKTSKTQLSSLTKTSLEDPVSNYKTKNEADTSKRKIVIVGGGVGGLAVAARVASSLKRNKQQQQQQQQHDWDVIVLEKNSNDMVGGRCGSFDVTVPNLGVFRHERGPSLLLLKNEYEELFQSCIATNDSKTTSSKTATAAESFGLKMNQCLPAYQVIFEDGDTVDLGFPKSPPSHLLSDSESLQSLRRKEQISRNKMNELEVDGAKKWDDYMKATSAFLDCGLPNFIEERFDLFSFPAFIIEALKNWGKSWPLKPHSDVLDASFSSEKMKALASFQDLYVGLEPYRNNNVFGGGVIKKTAPAVFGLLAALELHPTNKKAGVFAPIGGFRAVGEAFQNLAEHCGVQIQFDSTVTQINQNGIHVIKNKGNNQNVDDTSSTTTTTFVNADLIIVNADLPFATQSLISSSSETKERKIDNNQSQESFDWDDTFDYSSGVVAFHWCLDKQLDSLNTHNVFLIGTNRSQAEQSWRVVRDNPPISTTTSVEPFNFYVHRPVKTDSSAAPDGCDSIMILVPCPTLSRNKEYGQLPREEAMKRYKSQFDQVYIDKLRMAVIQRLEVLDELEDITDHIVHEFVDTPGTYADYYNVGGGTPFGLSHGFNQLSLMRPGAEYEEIDNVLFVGASSRPGNGVPLVLIGAKSVAEKVMTRVEEMSVATTEMA